MKTGCVKGRIVPVDGELKLVKFQNGIEAVLRDIGGTEDK
jgi:hypothetical protein